MKRFLLLTAAALAAVMIKAEVIDIDLNNANLFSVSSATTAVANGELTVNWVVDEAWGTSGVEVALNNLTGVTAVRFEYQGDGTGTGLIHYLLDTKGNRWWDDNGWTSLEPTAWTSMAVAPSVTLWDAPDYAFGEQPFVRVGFIANPATATSGTFAIRNIKITAVGEGGGEQGGEGGNSKPLTFNGETLPLNTDFSRTLIGTISASHQLPEISGIACSRVTPGYIWMQSDETDGGDTNPNQFIIATDETGQKLGAKVSFNRVYRWDWEDMCGGVYNGKDYLFIGGFGDNNHTDGEYCIIYFEEPAIDPANPNVSVTAYRIKFAYPDGQKHNCEALMYDNIEQTLYIITKVYYDVCKVYSLPFRLDYGTEQQTLTYVCDLGLKSDIGFNDEEQQCLGFHLVTAADISPDGKYILIKNHNNISGYADYSWVLYWERKDNESITETLKRQPQVIDCYEHEWQGEAICWLDDNTFYTTSDSDGEPPIYKYVRAEQPTAISAIEHCSEAVRLELIGNTLFVRHPQGIYTIDGRKVQ